MAKITLIGIVLFSACAFAKNLSLDLEANGLNLKGDFTFQIGKPLKISGSDSSGKSYQLKITSTSKRENIVELVYNLNRDGKIQKGSVITRQNEQAKITSTDDEQKTGITFAMKVTE